MIRRMHPHSSAIIASHLLDWVHLVRGRSLGLSSWSAGSFATGLVFPHCGTTFVAEGSDAGTAGPATAGGGGVVVKPAGGGVAVMLAGGESGAVKPAGGAGRESPPPRI